ncbi:MAG: hypothetical protein ABIH26_06890 [Candidatus Eisenbacteria bacterium]
MSGRRSSSRSVLLAFSLLLLVERGLLFAQVVQTPPIPVVVRPGDGEVLLEWDHPADSVISRLVVVDSSWGGTATLEVLGEYIGNCDMDLRFRTTNSAAVFTGPFVDAVLHQNVNPMRPNYWTGNAIPYAGGEPDICEDHSIQIIALGTDSLTESGNVSGLPLALEWRDIPDVDTLLVPADFQAGIDTILVTRGVWVGFQPGKINQEDECAVPARSRDIQLAWDYILTGDEETERVSSSDPGEQELTVCRPGFTVPFRFGLSVTITVDTAESGEILGSVPTGGDTLGVVSALWRKIDGYRVYRSEISNPLRFVLLRKFEFCDPRDVDFLHADPIRYLDREGVHNGFPYVYYVTAFDTLTHSESTDSLRSDRVFPRTQGTEDLSRVAVVPNPYKRNAAWEEGSERIQFTNLPQRAILKVFTVGGDLVREWEHFEASGGGNSNWDMRNADGDLVVSGVYVFHVRSAAGGEKVGKFIIVR